LGESESFNQGQHWPIRGLNAAGDARTAEHSEHVVGDRAEQVTGHSAWRGRHEQFAVLASPGVNPEHGDDAVSLYAPDEARGGRYLRFHGGFQRRAQGLAGSDHCIGIPTGDAATLAA